MIRFKLLAAILLQAATATPALAQAAIQEPGAFAFYHPNADLGLGSPRPLDAMASVPDRSRFKTMTMSHPIVGRRHQPIK